MNLVNGDGCKDTVVSSVEQRASMAFTGFFWLRGCIHMMYSLSRNPFAMPMRNHLCIVRAVQTKLTHTQYTHTHSLTHNCNIGGIPVFDQLADGSVK